MFVAVNYNQLYGRGFFFYKRDFKIAFFNVVSTRKVEGELWHKSRQIRTKHHMLLFIKAIYLFNCVIIRVITIFQNTYFCRIFDPNTLMRKVPNYRKSLFFFFNINHCRSKWPFFLCCVLRSFALCENLFEPHQRVGCLSAVNFVSCQVMVFASVWSLAQRNLTVCGDSDCNHESSIIRSPWPLGTVKSVMRKQV